MTFFQAEMHEFTSGDHWMYRLFKADVLSRFYLHKNALEEYERISEGGFAEMPYLVNKMAAAFNALQGQCNFTSVKRFLLSCSEPTIGFCGAVSQA